jgi:hypothetical protein
MKSTLQNGQALGLLKHVKRLLDYPAKHHLDRNLKEYFHHLVRNIHDQHLTPHQSMQNKLALCKEQ